MEAVAAELARAVTSYKVIVEKSTVPVRTSEWIHRIMVRNGVAEELFDVVSNPEFLREGTEYRRASAGAAIRLRV